ncbi:hypothetical protein [Desulfonatronum thioautotrophicum]|uniref:hypothetical protein n=1 Tax=Desulfonatronum thioautotrophicum TaxID=617001 RepID=UPI0005EB6FC8|nr:hypothetical protein [Desulfonatronum thioautotrophicum]
MEDLHTTKQKLVIEIEQLPNISIMELQNFVQYLKFKQAGMTALSSDIRELRPEDDPILRVCGFIDVPPFSETIDDTLYGAL